MNKSEKQQGLRKLDQAISDIQTFIGENSHWFPAASFTKLIDDSTNIKCTLRGILDELPSLEELNEEWDKMMNSSVPSVKKLSEEIDKILDNLGVK